MVSFKLNMQSIPIDMIVPNPLNPRIELTSGMPLFEKLKNSIEHFDYIDPIVWNQRTGMIVSGHQRLSVIKTIADEQSIPLTEIECIVVDMDEDTQNAFMVAINKITGLWDMAKLQSLFESMDDDTLSYTGFDDFEIDNILHGEDNCFSDDYRPEPKPTPEVMDDGFNDEGNDDPTSLDSITERCHKGDIWQLGRHRLMCGDTTSSQDMDDLMDGNKANICFTSPPYNASNLIMPKSKKLSNSTKKKYRNNEDNDSTEDYTKFLISSIDNILNHCTEALINIGILANSKISVIEMLNNYKHQFKDIIYWQKSHAVPQTHNTVISSITEPIFAFSKEDSSRSFKSANFGTIYYGVITGNSLGRSNEYSDVHKATFPIYLPTEIVDKFTHPKDLVLDAFGGTGTTLLACEQLDRQCYMMEIDPRYCDIIIHRYEQLTKDEAILISSSDERKYLTS